MDPGIDAQLPSMFIYLYSRAKGRIPDEWEAAMEDMHREMQKYVSKLANIKTEGSSNGTNLETLQTIPFTEVITEEDLARLNS